MAAISAAFRSRPSIGTPTLSDQIFEIIALIFSAVYFGATLYITLVEHPAFLACPTEVALAHWRRSVRMSPRYAASALIAASAALFYSKAVLRSPWTWGSLLLLAVLPFTNLLLLPIQLSLATSDPDSSSIASQKQLKRWGQRHAVRTGLGGGAFVLFLLAALKAI